jgi:hypothetical protein
MAACVCVACLWLFAGSLVQDRAGPVAVPEAFEPDPLLSAPQAVADVNELCVILDARADDVSSFEALVGRIGERLDREGIKRVQRDTGSVPRLVVYIEGTAIPECDKYVYRVQTALHRPVMLPGDSPASLPAEVWRLRPIGGVAARSQAGRVMASTVELQVSAFIAAVKTVRQLPVDPGGVGQDGSRAQGPAEEQSPRAVSGYPFVASRSGEVFHRSDCRWAQNISAGNLVGYETREEALRAGKRPCKSCKP